MSEEKKRAGKSLLKDVGLIVLGFMLATVGQWFWQVRGENRQELSTALILRQSVVNEMQLCEGAKAAITNIIAAGLPQNTRVLPEAFDTLHSPSLYLENRSRAISAAGLRRSTFRASWKKWGPITFTAARCFRPSRPLRPAPCARY